MACCMKYLVTGNAEIKRMVGNVHEVVFCPVLVRATTREVMHHADGCAYKFFKVLCCYIHTLVNKIVFMSEVVRNNA